jgi:hypothetical protein
MFTERLKLSQTKVKHVPWRWLFDTFGPRGIRWEATLGDKDGDWPVYILFKHAEDKALFILTWS